MSCGALFAALWMLAFCGLRDAFPSGASPKACVQMIPGHVSGEGNPIIPQESASPYSIVVDGSEYNPGGMVRVTITADPTTATFQGFLLQARAIGRTDPVGTFLAGSDGASKLITCNATGDAVTHTAATEKQSGMSFMWQAPTAGVGDIKFLLTVAQDHDVFWVRMESNTLTASAPVTALSIPLLVILLVVTMATAQD
ncbi:putative defense protein 1 [Asterias amurensis]|uniref:putative defense protein 1 n=1 Tax=Asterias amurensis TaxID=7602 RepID=UPI003AB24B35